MAPGAGPGVPLAVYVVLLAIEPAALLAVAWWLGMGRR